MISETWNLPPLSPEFSGRACIITVAYNSSTNSGFRTQIFSTINFVNLTNTGIIAGAIVVSLVLSWVAYSQVYRKRYLIPKQRAHRQELQEVLDMFNDVTNISRFLVLYRRSGIAIFDPFKKRGLEASIFGGFLQAIQAFAIDVANGSEDETIQTKTQLSEITYEGFRIMMHDGSAIRTALVYKGIPSKTLREKIKVFTSQFEERFQEQLLKHGHEPRKFEEAFDLLEEVFHISLLFPHTVEPKTEDVSLTVLEGRLHYVALNLQKDRKHVLLSDIVNTYLETIKENPTELLKAIIKLRDKRLLIPSKNSENNSIEK